MGRLLFFSKGRDMFESYIKEMVETRRALHRRPELGWTEFETTWYV